MAGKGMPAVRIAAFDSKPFNRGGIAEARGAPGEEKYTGHSTQLGIGVVIPDENAFTRAFVEEFDRLKGKFEIDTGLPFMPTNGLLKHGRRKAIAFADRLVSSIQGTIEGIHCSFVNLPPTTHPTIPVGGNGDSTRAVPTRSFIDRLGPMFSYLTAQSYVYTNKTAPGDADIRIDSFTSKQTRAWDMLTGHRPRVYWKGDECNAPIACADLLAFLTDAKLYYGYMKIEPDSVRKVWEPYSFDVGVSVYGHGNLWSYAWYLNEPIDIGPYLAKPTVFLSIDNLADPAPDGADEGQDDVGGAASVPDDAKPKPISFPMAIKRSDTYVAAVRRAFELSGSLKIFKLDEDAQSVRDNDVFVYVGDKSEQVGRTLQHSADIEVVSGLELRRLIKSNT